MIKYFFSFQALREMVITHIHCFENCLEQPETPEDACSRLGTAMALALLVTSYQVKLDQKDFRLLYTSFSIRPDPETKKCHDYDGLMTRHFAEYDK